ncbi:uncharacterized protein STEHIDRAFT_169584 [Stereum hirsutum FP-91666 SS1]|uniref:uncharacterized protein n=1 Tax=Stereum hirsutum (strain FP-91666) TaxID=721885 RepID=UPI0004449AF8|nr:uncharacterized protein STEHIDRAFT_169584 [Stereum hirsutum FP-91666 SS1]EIM84642.1 hypothetical protein STEHIDRAFT_169584 [Stereum hirsutum FP-91666 SS1]
MSKVIDGYKIYMPTAASKFPYTPDIPNEHMPQPLSSPTPTGHGSTSTKRRRIKEVSAVNQEKEKFRNDPGCFVTGMSDLTLQAAHIVNAARDQSDPSRLPNVLHILTDVLTIIRNPGSFTLESLENSFLLSPSLHTHLDLYATYVITLSKDSLKEVVKILEEANQVWDYAVNELGQKKTPRTITKVGYVSRMVPQRDSAPEAKVGSRSPSGTTKSGLIFHFWPSAGLRFLNPPVSDRKKSRSEAPSPSGFPYKESPSKPRKSSILLFPQWANPALIAVKFDLILLHPLLFLPREQPFVTLKTRTPPTYSYWKLNNRELRELNFAPESSLDPAPESAPYPPFFHTSRVDGDNVNPFLLILNAGLKLAHHRDKYGFTLLTARQVELAELTLKAYDLIYHLPQNFSFSPFPAAAPAIASLPLMAATSQRAPDTRQAEDNGMPAGSRASNDKMEEDGQLQHDEDITDDESEGDGDLLSRGESDMIVAKLVDKNTTLKERQELGALLFGWTQPHRPFPFVPDVELPEELTLFGTGQAV